MSFFGGRLSLRVLIQVILVFLMGQIVSATDEALDEGSIGHNAFRDANINFHKYLEIQNKLIKEKKLKAKDIGFGDFDTVLDKAQSVNEVNWEQVFVTKVNQAGISDLFEYVRDKRDFIDQAGFKRRITWLYPDDGCYVRSAIMQSLVQEKVTESWSQIFLFGNLELKTNYSPDGAVTWWYHVAPIIKTELGIFVFDPSVQASGPMPLKDWLEKVNAGADAKVAICDAKAYIPDSSCSQESESHGLEALDEEKEIYFQKEWNRLEHLGLKPELILGEKPPWKTNNLSLFQ